MERRSFSTPGVRTKSSLVWIPCSILPLRTGTCGSCLPRRLLKDVSAGGDWVGLPCRCVLQANSKGRVKFQYSPAEAFLPFPVTTKSGIKHLTGLLAAKSNTLNDTCRRTTITRGRRRHIHILRSKSLN